MDIIVVENELDRDGYITKPEVDNDKPFQGKLKLDLPFPQYRDEDTRNHFVFRLVYKPQSGVLWGYNQFHCNSEHLQELDYF